MGKTYTGVDIGNYSLKLAVSDGDSVKSIACEPLPEGLVAENRIVSFDAMADFLKAVASKTRGASRDVSVLLPTAISITRRIHSPVMTKKELEVNLPYEFRDFIQQGKDKYFFDYAVLTTHKDAEGAPESMEILAAAVLKRDIEDFREMFKRAGMRMRIAQPHASCYQNLVSGNPRALAQCCVIDFAHTSTKLHFFLDGNYDVTRVIEFGGADIDRAIAQEMNVDVHIANSYKESNYDGVQECTAAKGAYESIAVEVGRALNFYSFNNPDTPVEVAYYCGGGAANPHLLNAVSSYISIEMQDIATIMPPASHNTELLTICPAAVGATME